MGAIRPSFIAIALITPPVPRKVNQQHGRQVTEPFWFSSYLAWYPMKPLACYRKLKAGQCEFSHPEFTSLQYVLTQASKKNLIDDQD
jgi:hypothetical protein